MARSGRLPQRFIFHGYIIFPQYGMNKGYGQDAGGRNGESDMSNAPSKINYLQLFMMFALMNGLTDHVIINPMLLDASGRDAWITPLAAGAPFVLFSVLLALTMRKSGQTEWQAWLSRRAHPVLAWALRIPVGILLYAIGATTVIHTVKWNAANYMPATNAIVTSTALVAICLVLALWGMSTIAVTSGVLLPIVVALGIFVSAANGKEKDYKLLQPALEQGWGAVYDGLVYAGGGYAEIVLMLLLQHRLERPVKPWQLLLQSLFTVVIMTGPVIGAITEFGPIEAANQMASPYEQWRLIKIGQYIEHVDFFSIFQWLAGASIRVSLAVFLLADLLPVKKNDHRQWAIGAIMCSYLVIAVLPMNDYAFYQWMARFYIPVSFAVLVAVAAVWMGVTLLAKPARKGEAT